MSDDNNDVNPPLDPPAKMKVLSRPKSLLIKANGFSFLTARGRRNCGGWYWNHHFLPWVEQKHVRIFNESRNWSTALISGTGKKISSTAVPTFIVQTEYYDDVHICKIWGNGSKSRPLNYTLSRNMVGHLFQNYDAIYVRFFPTYTCNHSCYTIYERFFATYTCVLPCLVGTNAHICAHKKACALQTSMWYMGSQKVVV